MPATAHGATKRPDLRATGLLTNTSSVAAGDSFTAFGRVANRAGRRAVGGRLTFSLRTSRTARRGRALKGLTIKRTRGGRGRLFKSQLRISRSQAPRRYYLFACVRHKGRTKAKCVRRALTVTRAPSPSQPTTPPAQPPAPDTRPPAVKLRDAVTAEGMTKHLRAFQDIATANGGNRASGFPGYDASAAYVVQQLRDAGYSPTTQVFDFVVFSETTPVFQQTAPTPTTYEPDDDDDPSDLDFLTMSYSEAGDTTNDVDPIDLKLDPVPTNRTSTSGCEDADFAGFVEGDIALMQRGTCSFYIKVRKAQEHGASGAVILNEGTAGRTDVFAGTLGETAQDGEGGEVPDITIPAIGVSYALGAELATTAGLQARVKVDATNIERRTLNVLADTPTGNPNTTIVQGSHLDSVQEGPGINDNGSGSAYNLESAIQMAKLGMQPANRIRFAFWGAEESGLVGATRYIGGISEEEFEKLKMNLNFDMLGSPNFARFIYDGDFSDSPPPATAPNVNRGAAEIEQRFKQYFDSQGQQSKPTGFDGRSDYKPFQDNGVAAGGLFTGAEVAKTAAEVTMFGGIPQVAFDPNYHSEHDTLANINPVGYEQMTDAAAFVMGSYAMDPAFPDRFAAPAAARRGAQFAGRSQRVGSFLQR